MRRASVFISVLAVVALSLIALGPTEPTAAQDATPMVDGQGFVGSWWVDVSPAQGPPFLGLVTLSADGTAVTSPPPVLPRPGAPGEANFTSAGHGAWESSSPDTAILTFVVQTADGQGNPFGTNTVRLSIMLGTDGQTFSGEGVASIADPRGNAMANEQLTFQATRIVAEGPGMPPAGTPAV